MYSDLHSECYKVVFVRHGECSCNQQNRFCGWTDDRLSTRGLCEAKQAGQMLKQNLICFDVAYTSALLPAIKTCHYILEELKSLWIPVYKSWRLNERMYGDLQGLNITEATAKHGDSNVRLWCKSYDTAPPPLDALDPRNISGDSRYANLDRRTIPLTECLEDTESRVLPYWFDHIVPTIKSGKRVLITAHNCSICVLMKHLDKLSIDQASSLDIATGIPLVYELDANMEPYRHYYLANDEIVAASLNRFEQLTKLKI